MELADEICELVRQRRIVELRGADDPADEARVAEPHAVYIGSNNSGFVDFYQLAGWSRSGRLPGWRRFALTDIAAVRPLIARFEPRPDFRPENRGFYRAFVCAAEPPSHDAAAPDAATGSA